MSAIIIGAGIAGLALAKGLRGIGLDAQIFEQSPQMKAVGAGIALTTNGLRALQALDLYEAVVGRGQEIRRLSVLDQDGRVLESTDHLRLSERFGHVSAVVLHRAALQDALLSSLPPSIVRTGKRCTHVQSNARHVEVTFEDGETLESDLVFACDRIHSVVRTSLYPDWHERFAGYTCWRGITRTPVPGVEAGHLTESWGHGVRFGMAALKDAGVYWFACVSAARPRDPALSNVGLKQLCEMFRGFHAPVQDVLRATDDEAVIWTDIFDVAPEHPFTRRRVVLLGDAAHAVTPDLGQGACQALEDAAVLPNLLAQLPFEHAFARFERLRVPRTRRLVRDSRRFGRIAQMRHPLAVRARNALVRNLPPTLSERWLDSILDVRFESVRIAGSNRSARC